MASKALQEIQKKASWGMMTDADVAVIREEMCRKCTYQGGYENHVHCDYLRITGHMRGCRPDKCDKFEPGPQRKIKVQPSLDCKTGYRGGSRARKSKTYIGLIIDDYLARNNMYQKDLGEKIGVTGQTIGDWRTLKTKPYGENLEKLCGVLGISPETARKAIEKGRIE